jgi:hypothetical protein
VCVCVGYTVEEASTKDFSITQWLGIIRKGTISFSLERELRILGMAEKRSEKSLQIEEWSMFNVSLEAKGQIWWTWNCRIGEAEGEWQLQALHHHSFTPLKRIWNLRS